MGHPLLKCANRFANPSAEDCAKDCAIVCEQYTTEYELCQWVWVGSSNEEYGFFALSCPISRVEFPEMAELLARGVATSSAQTGSGGVVSEQTHHRRATASDPTACTGRRQASPVFDATAGPLKSITKRARRRGWTSIRCGTSRPYPGILASSPSPIAYCVPPHTTQRSCTSFNVNSRWISKAAHRSGVGPPKHRACGLWLASSVQD